MGQNLSSFSPQTQAKVPTEQICSPVVTVNGRRHERMLPESVVPYIDPDDIAARRASPLEADYSDTREIREQAIIFAEMHDLQVQLSNCYYQHGVNHHVMCKPLVESYLRRLADNNFVDSNPDHEYAHINHRHAERRY